MTIALSSHNPAALSLPLHALPSCCSSRGGGGGASCCPPRVLATPAPAPNLHDCTPCCAGWAFPWGLRARLAELLLRGMFDTLDEGQYTEHRQELLSLVQASFAALQRVLA